jgi:EAL domain-containing protein (putative c-di-GMP-specific phosphodiesterase class I)
VVTVGTSIGIALGPDDGINPGEFLQRADLALYRAKSEGRNNFRFFDETMSRTAAARLKLVNDLRATISRGGFELHYQPIVDARTCRPCGVEALLRWRHPVEGLLLPESFIPLAEETGLIDAIGAWVLQAACMQATAWPEHIKLAVNLSALQFRTGKLFDVIMRVLADSRLPPGRLELEITESVFMQDQEKYAMILKQLKDVGISVVLDDFGTGYSSLNYLTKFPFDKIKIDKSFTGGLTHRADCAAVVASVLTLARGLDIEVTAEGVETQEQLDLLRIAGVDQVQGYLFALPCPASELDFFALERNGQTFEAA